MESIVYDEGGEPLEWCCPGKLGMPHPGFKARWMGFGQLGLVEGVLTHGSGAETR